MLSQLDQFQPEHRAYDYNPLNSILFLAALGAGIPSGLCDQRWGELRVATRWRWRSPGRPRLRLALSQLTPCAGEPLRGHGCAQITMRLIRSLGI